MPASTRETCRKKPLSTFVITAVVFLIAVLVIVVLHSIWQPGFEKVVTPYTLNRIMNIIRRHSCVSNGRVLERMFPILDFQEPVPDLNPDPDDCTSKVIVAADQSPMWNASTLALSQAWSKAEQKAAAPAHSYMEKRHSVAIYVFTQAVRRPGRRTVLAAAEGSENQLSSETQSLFSYLSNAIQILKHNQRLCRTTSYTTDAPSGLNVSGKLLRFGTFVLGSGGHHLRGNACFEVHTCFGADVTHYSAWKQSRQVLIPPYEVFRVADGPSDPRRGRVTYRLESNLDCVYDTRSGSLHPVSAPSDLSWVIFGIMCMVVVFLLLPFVIFKVLKK